MLKGTKISIVLCARDEEKTIARTLTSLRNQTLPPSQIIVVNDGSMDGTRQIAVSFGAKVVDLPPHAENFAGTPKLAKVFNAGFKVVNDADYIMIIGADDTIPADYVKRIVERMEINPKLVVASGQLADAPSEETVPRGGGRMIKFWFWQQVGARYPEAYGWEDWINYKAMQLGYEVRGFKDILFQRHRRQKRTWKKAFGDGKSMYALGYHWTHAIARCFLLFLRSPKLSLAQILGWTTHRGVERMDISDWLNKSQSDQFCENVRKKMKGERRRQYG